MLIEIAALPIQLVVISHCFVKQKDGCRRREPINLSAARAKRIFDLEDFHGLQFRRVGTAHHISPVYFAGEGACSIIHRFVENLLG
jgi:hypothetical protein